MHVEHVSGAFTVNMLFAGLLVSLKNRVNKLFCFIQLYIK